MIEIGGVTIQPGDLIIGDLDGVVSIPGVDATATIEAGLKRQADELTMLERLRSGETTLDIFNLN